MASCRRVTDAILASTALVLLAPLCLARTMRPAGGGRPGDVPLRQRRDDPRCTRGGRLLRRAHVARAWAGRHDAIPGLTGEWQVGRCAQTDVAELIRFDRGYLAARSLRRDLTVLARTVACVARGAGR